MTAVHRDIGTGEHRAGRIDQPVEHELVPGRTQPGHTIPESDGIDPRHPSLMRVSETDFSLGSSRGRHVVDLTAVRWSQRGRVSVSGSTRQLT